MSRRPVLPPGARVALLTQHGKERVIAPAFLATFDVCIEVVGGIDTDTFGSFTGERPRAGSQLEAARHKARAGMAQANVPYGVASEGAFCPDPMTGFMPWNIEVVVMIDDTRQIEIAGWAHAPALHVQKTVSTWEAAKELAHAAGFPEHHLVLRPNSHTDPRIRKGIASWEALMTAFEWAQGESEDGVVAIENDLRAHANPTRMLTIAKATRDLVARAQSHCPSCQTPGFWPAEVIRGLPCALCGAPTSEVLAERLACLECHHEETRTLQGADRADPSRCDWCNP